MGYKKQLAIRVGTYFSEFITIVGSSIGNLPS